MRGIKETLFIICLTLWIAFAVSLTHASDLQIKQSTLYPYQNSIEIQDEFISGLSTNGLIGSLGWSFAGGTSAAISSSANRIGLYRRATGAVINTVAQTVINFASPLVLDPSLPHKQTFILSISAADADTQMRIGSMNATGGNPPDHGIFIEKLGGDTNWFCVTRSATVQTRTDTTIAVDTNFHSFTYTRNSSGVQFSIDGVNVCGVMTTNIPTTFIGPTLQMVNLAAANKQYDIDYYQLQIFGLVRQ